MPAPKVRSKDSTQQRLRDHKRQWNATYKDFSQRLKGFKDGINGRGNAKLGLPPSNIKEPMPAEVGSYLSQLAGEFQTIVGDAESIIAEQAQYARTRRRRRPKGPEAQQAPVAAPEQPPAAPEAAKVDNALSRLGASEFDLNKEASSKLSRFWQYISSIFSGKEFNKQRIGLLSQSADLYYSLLDLENNILSTKVDSIPNTIAQYKAFKYNFETLVGTFRGVKNMVERKAKERGVVKPTEKNEKTEESENKEAPATPQQEQRQEKISEPPQSGKVEVDEPLSADLHKIKNDIHMLFNENLAKNQILAINEMFDELEDETDPHGKSMWEDRIKEHYQELTKHLANEAQKRFGPANIRSVQDIIDLVRKNKKAELVSDYMIKTSHNAMTRALKKKWMKLRPFNKTAPIRLEITDIIDRMKDTIKKIMDNLEKDLSIEELNVFFETLNEDRDALKRPLHVLNVYYMKDFFSREEKTKNKQKNNKGRQSIDPMDYVLQRKLKRELYEDMT